MKERNQTFTPSSASNVTTTQQVQAIDEDRIIKQVSAVGVFGNIVLTMFKLMAGILGHSNAMISDAIHSLSDVFATLVAFVGVKLSHRSADTAHPYGHERMECVASLSLGLILLITGLGIGKVGIEHIFFTNHASLEAPSAIALLAAVVSIGTKEAMYWYTRHYAKILDSQAFMADAWHHRSDAFSSIGSLVGIAGAMLGYPVLDSVASVVICCFILKVSYDVLSAAISNMLDASGGDEYNEKLAAFIDTQEGVKHIDMLQSRLFGNRVYVDLEIAVDGDQTLREAHDISVRVHRGVEKNFPEVKHIMIHLNPLN